MAPSLYLDTARLGKMTPGAQAVHHDFSRLAGEVGASIQFTDILWHGLKTAPPAIQDRFPALSEWKGVAALKQSLCDLTTLPQNRRALLAGRSAQLMKLAATLLCRPCRNVLVTDIGWPPYQSILEHEARRSNRRHTTVPLSRDLLTGTIDAQEVTERIRSAYLQHHCDGLFLPAVSHLGIQLPVRKIVQSIEATARLRFVVVDGAQDFCHVGSDLGGDCADIYLAGTHKWLGSFYPLGVAFYGKPRSLHVVESVLRNSIDCWQIDDPLLRFIDNALHDDRPCPDETVNMSGVFACQGAVEDANSAGLSHDALLSQRIENTRRVTEQVNSSPWTAELPHKSLQSGILLLKSSNARTQSLPAQTLRKLLHEQGLTLTAYESGRVRLSMPTTPLHEEELQTIEAALESVA